jgi:diguanylate cyclase (GGDEF)-like protein
MRKKNVYPSANRIDDFVMTAYIANLKQIIRVALFIIFDAVAIIFIMTFFYELSQLNTDYSFEFKISVLSLLVVSVLYLLAGIWLLKRKIDTELTLIHKMFTSSYIFFILIWAAYAAAITGKMSYLIVGVMLMMGLFYLTPTAAGILLLISYSFFLCVLVFNHESMIDHFKQDYDLIGIGVLAWYITRNNLYNRMHLYNENCEIEEMNIKLEQVAIRDSLTSLYNHKASYEYLEVEVLRNKRYGVNLTVLMLDIDHFKKVNDTYGHQAGDDVLTAVSKLLVESTRETDIVGRYGGEEFIIIMPETDLVNGQILSERIRCAIENHDFKQPSSITISGGIAQYNDGGGKNLVNVCDSLLYKAKENGRNRIEVADSE